MPNTKTTMSQRTCNIIRCCKGSCMLPAGKDKSRLRAVAAYMSDECACPVDDYKGRLLEQVMMEAMFDYLDHADRPGNELRRLFDVPGMGPEPTMSERIASMFALAQIMDSKNKSDPKELSYVNGFTPALIKQSEIDLGEKPGKRTGGNYGK